MSHRPRFTIGLAVVALAAAACGGQDQAPKALAFSDPELVEVVDGDQAVEVVGEWTIASRDLLSSALAGQADESHARNVTLLLDHTQVDDAEQVSQDLLSCTQVAAGYAQSHGVDPLQVSYELVGHSEQDDTWEVTQVRTISAGDVVHDEREVVTTVGASGVQLADASAEFECPFANSPVVNSLFQIAMEELVAE